MEAHTYLSLGMTRRAGSSELESHKGELLSALRSMSMKIHNDIPSPRRSSMDELTL